MATENVNMNIENTTTSASTPGDATVRPSSGNVQLTPEMLSSAQVSVNMKFLQISEMFLIWLHSVVLGELMNLPQLVRG